MRINLDDFYNPKRDPEPDPERWYSVFVFWPRLTEDNMLVCCETVYRRWVPEQKGIGRHFSQDRGGHWLYSWCRAPFNGDGL